MLCPLIRISVVPPYVVPPYLSFISKCLRLNLIPTGFRLNFKPTIPLINDGAFQHQNQTYLEKCSRNLMRNTISPMVSQKKHYHSQMINGKQRLKTLCDERDVSTISQIIHKCNQSLYNELNSTKTTKLSALISERSAQNKSIHRNSIHQEHMRVVTIPEDLELPQQEKSVLAKGLTFVPQNKRNNEFNTRYDVEQFYRRLRLRYHFSDQDNDEDAAEVDTFTRLAEEKKSNWTPSPGASNTLDLYVDKCRHEISNLDLTSSPPRFTSNITTEERQAIQSLRSNQDIVIKRADKGGAVVVWRKDLYITEAERQLNDRTFYESIQHDLTEKHHKEVSKTVKSFIESEDLPSTASHLIQSNPRTPRFYLLPKIHKPGNPGRPIVSACNCPTEQISKYLDQLFAPFVQSLPTYVKDTSHALRIFNNFVFTGRHKIIFTMDVKSLYTSIPHQDGLEAVKYFMDVERIDPFPPTSTILRLLELVLTLNNFTFNGNHYIQRRGVAMGQKVGPSYACLFMGYLEKKFVASYEGPKPDHLFRYIDDFVGMTTNCSETEVKNFITAFNEFHPAIQLTHSISTTSLPFLDINLSINHTTAKIDTTVHYKPTDSHAYLSYDSSHPRRCKDSIPYSQLLRLRRLCSDNEDFIIKTEEMISFFKARGYPDHVLQSALDRVSNNHTEKDNRDNNSRIPLVITYHPTNSQVVKILMSNFKLLQECKDTENIFKDPPLVAYRRDKNLSDILVRSADPKPTNQPGTFSCTRRTCTTCSHVNSAPCVIGNTGTFNIKDSFDCTSRNLVYVTRDTLAPQR